MEKKDLNTILAWLILFLLSFAYYKYSTALDFMMIIILVFCCWFIGKKFKTINKNNNDYMKLSINIMICSIAAMVLLRFFRVSSYPVDFVADEWNGITSAYFRLMGKTSFFNFNPRFGSSFPYVHIAAIMAFMALFKEHLDLLRLIPAFVSLATALSLYLLGRIMEGKKLGIIFAFLFLTSNWALYLSKTLMENIYIPLFVVLFILFMMYFIKSGQKKYMIFAGIIYAVAFYSYSSWLSITAILAYFIFEYRKEIGKKNIVWLGVLMLPPLVVYGFINVLNPEAAEWAKAHTIFRDGGNIFDVFVNSVNILKALFMPIDQINPIPIPALSSVDFILLALATAFPIKNINDKTIRVFFVSFLLSLTPILFCYNPASLLRFSLILPFEILVIGLGFNKIIGNRFSYMLVFVRILFFVGTLFYFNIQWGNDINSSSMEKDIATYINTKYKGNNILYFHTGKGGGSFPSYLRTKSAYDSLENAQEALFLVNFFKRSLFKGMGDFKYFYDYNNQNSKTLCLYELPIQEQSRKFFYQLSDGMSEINRCFWQSDFRKGYEEAESMLIKSSGNQSLIFANTMLRGSEMSCVPPSYLNDFIIRAVTDKNEEIRITTDMAFSIAQIAFQQNQIVPAKEYLGIAVKNDPEWQPAVQLYNSILSAK
jgi:hypothetical protein